SGLFFYGIVLGLAERNRARLDAHSARAVAWVAALLFLVHPIGTETVTYISGRATGLMACTYLAALYFYLRATSAGGESTGLIASRAYLAALGCFLVSLLSKETALTLPVALLLVDTVALGRRGSDLRAHCRRAHAAFWVVWACFLASALLTPR